LFAKGDAVFGAAGCKTSSEAGIADPVGLTKARIEVYIDAETTKNYIEEAPAGSVESGLLPTSPNGQPCQSPPPR
jgi:hypothetical protein